MDKKFIGLIICLTAAGCTSLHPIRQDPDGTNFKGPSRATAYCPPKVDTCAHNLIYRTPENAIQAIHNVSVYRDFYDYLATGKRENAAVWSDLFALSTVLGVLAVANESSHAIRVGVFGAGVSEIMDTRYQFKKQADEYRLAGKVFGCVESHSRAVEPADGRTVTVPGPKVFSTTQVSFLQRDGKPGTPQPATVLTEGDRQEIVIDVNGVLRRLIVRINERLGERLEALTPAKPNAEDLRNAFVRQKEAIEKAGDVKQKTSGHNVLISASADAKALKAGATFQEDVDACFAEMK